MAPRNVDRRVRTSYRQLQRRRARILYWLMAAAAGTLAVALWRGGSWWELHIASAFSLAAYLALLVGAKRRREERIRKVRPLVAAHSESRMERRRASADR